MLLRFVQRCGATYCTRRGKSMEGDNAEGLRVTNALGQPTGQPNAADGIVPIYNAACPLPSHCAFIRPLLLHAHPCPSPLSLCT